MNIFERIGRWLTPYKYAFEDKDMVEYKVPKKATVARRERLKTKRQEIDEEAKKELSDFLERGEIGIKVVDINNIMSKEDAYIRLKSSDSHIGYFIHTDNHHQLAVRFEENSAWKYYERSNKRRVKLRPLIEYTKKGSSDRTHLIPIGFHGSENDECLLIDFNSTINRQNLKKFEEYVSGVNEKSEVLWFIDIVRQNDDSVIWNAVVWDEDGRIIIEDQFHDKNKFRWR